jgi:hypothetical protein
MTERIQRRRTKGWRMPEGAIYVGRPTRWGNSWKIGDREFRGVVLDGSTVVLAYRDNLGVMSDDELAEWLAPLRGHDLACWCPLDQPCHADVLLELANG